MLIRRSFNAKRFFPSNAVPIIDIAPLFDSSSLEGRVKVSKEIGKACEEIGFFAIKNHSVPLPVIDNMLESSRAFFDLKADEKNKMAMMSTDYPYGYSGMMEETLSGGKAHEDGSVKNALPDLKESFSMGPYNPASGVAKPVFPNNPETFGESYMQYYKEMEILTGRMCSAFALALNLPEQWFDDKIDRHRSCIRSINYPNSKTEAGQLRASAHTDYGTMTILLQDATGGLQVLDKSQRWIDVEPVPGTFVVNIGDLMARWTNDKWVSTMHRVVDKGEGTPGRRQSVAFFQNINGDHVVDCIETCSNEDNPPKYPAISAFDHLISKHSASMNSSISDGVVGGSV